MIDPDITEKANRIASAWESLAHDNDVLVDRYDGMAENAKTDADMIAASRAAAECRDKRNIYQRCARAMRELVA